MFLPITKLRTELTDFLDFPGKIENVKGITLIEKRDHHKDRLLGYNCVVYCFGLGKEIPFNFDEEIVLTTKGYSEVDNPIREDLVVYIHYIYKEQVHIGIYKGSNKVLSKWGYGNVYLHNLDLVPSSYGNIIRFFRKKF